MSSKSKVPQIRFKGFSGEWEESDLGGKVEFFSGLTYSPNNVVKDNGTLVLRSSNVKDGRIVDADNVYVSSDVVNCSNVQKGDIAVVVRNGSRSLIGKHAQIQKDMKNTVIGAFMTGIRSEQPSFTNALLDSSKFTKEIEKNLGATINQITTGAFKKMIFSFPDQAEQTKIGDYFQQLDKLIEQKEKKYQKLKQFKKAMLSKMFPKHGADTPKIRFKGFSGKWEEKKLGDIANITIGEFVIKTKQNPNSPYPVYNGGKSYTGFYDEFNNDGNKIIISARGANAGYVNFETRRYWAGNSCYSIDFLDNNLHYIEFFYHYIKKNENRFTDYQQAANIPSVSKADAQKFIVHFPKIEEQTKIGNYFQKLDTQIELQNEELQKLKNIKKASLAKMFV